MENIKPLLKRRREIEVNPYTSMIDINDILTDDVPDRLTILKDLQNMLLRYNTALKQWYKKYSAKEDDPVDNDAVSFAMDLKTFWKFVKEVRIMTPLVNIASINRSFYQGGKSRFMLNIKIEEICQKILLLKAEYQSTGKISKISEVLVKKLTKTCHLNDPIDHKNYKAPVEDDAFLEVFDIHDGNRVVLFRHFVELLVRVSYLKYGNLREIHKNVEKLLANKIIPNLEKQNKEKDEKKKDKKDEEKLTKYSTKLRKEFTPKLTELFKKHSVRSQTGLFYSIDYTINIRSFFKLMQEPGILKEEADKNLFIAINERYFDPDESIIRSDKRWEKRKGKQKSVKEKDRENEREKEKEHFMDRDRKMALLAESELIFEEFLDVLFTYFLKKTKESNLHKKESQIEEFFRENFNTILRYYDLEVDYREERILPVTDKDKMVEQLIVLRRKKQEEEERKRALDKERINEERERKLMSKEDNNILSDKEDEQPEQEEEDDEDSDDF